MILFEKVPYIFLSWYKATEIFSTATIFSPLDKYITVDLSDIVDWRWNLHTESKCYKVNIIIGKQGVLATMRYISMLYIL
jgi:hypothetical protein